MTQDSNYPRDLRGYGRLPAHARWPGGARIALQFVLNYEEGAENCVLDGDAASEVFLSDIVGAQAFPMRHMSMESLYEYGSRAGLWRVLRAFERHRLPLTIFAVAAAMRRNAEVATAFKELGHEIACHGLRWISYQQVDEATERAHIAEATATLNEIFGAAPLGWYTGRDSPQTRRLVVEHGGFLYDSDSYADDLPYWTLVAGPEAGAATQGASRDSLCARYQRHALRNRTGVQFGYAVLRLSARCVRRALPGGRPAGPRCAEDAVGRPALPPGGTPRAGSPRSSDFSTMCCSTNGFGSAAESTSRAIGLPSIHR
jgi:peptidoglycan/xylan/chitin deacetylase (PgdA/CDA1 family)